MDIINTNTISVLALIALGIYIFNPFDILSKVSGYHSEHHDDTHTLDEIQGIPRSNVNYGLDYSLAR